MERGAVSAPVAAGDAVFLNLDAASMGMRSSLCETQTEPHTYDVYIFI